MAMATIEAEELIQTAGLPIDNIYTSNLPEEMKENTTETIILITSVKNSPDVLGNDDFFGMTRQIEIQIFYKLELDFDPDEVELKLLHLFNSNHWSISDNHGYSVDPDTTQLTATYYFTQNKLN